ncbi:MAG: protein phosphatase 2C domain-containing protein [Opitutaceae bacterium]|nr:protein phosphatase 2C domain-containing protein [Opitutaceae bacterium]
MLSLRAAALTDIGRVRRENEDRCIFDEQAQIFGVADGVGGLPGGGEAAQLTAERVLAAVNALPAITEPELVAAVREVNESVIKLGRKMSPNMGIGTTLTFGCVRDGELLLAHVGDSRCYGLREGQLLRLTEDHSVENEARLRRARGEIVYYHESNRNALTRCIGQPTPPEVDTASFTLAAGDRYLFCTDGVTRMISDAELKVAIGRGDDPHAALAEIVNLAVRRGGPDNATGVLVFVNED